VDTVELNPENLDLKIPLARLSLSNFVSSRPRGPLCHPRQATPLPRHREGAAPPRAGHAAAAPPRAVCAATAPQRAARTAVEPPRAAIPPEPGVEVEYPGWVLAVDIAQALELDHELGHHDGAVPLAHPRELWHVLRVRCARGANDGDGGARGEAAGEEDDSASRVLGDRGGALGDVGGAGGGGGEQRPGVPHEGGDVLPGGEAERPCVVGHAVSELVVLCE
jgi:hypothetical protein